MKVNYDKRIIQLFEFNDLETEDVYVIEGEKFNYSQDHISVSVSGDVLIIPAAEAMYDAVNKRLVLSKDYVRLHKLTDGILSFTLGTIWQGGFNVEVIYETVARSLEHLRETTKFPNKQMLDTGFRDANIFVSKRYRELQLQINNINNVDMEFGMDFQIAGEPRNTDFIYEVSQIIDEIHEDEGIVYIDATPYMAVDSVDVEKINNWMLRHSLTADISLWKVRAAISGKGIAPRMRLFTRKMYNYQLLGINWVYREMNMR